MKTSKISVFPLTGVVFAWVFHFHVQSKLEAICLSTSVDQSWPLVYLSVQCSAYASSLQDGPEGVGRHRIMLNTLPQACSYWVSSLVRSVNKKMVAGAQPSSPSVARGAKGDERCTKGDEMCAQEA